LRNDKLLFVRRAREPGRGLYSFPGGRVEFGETLLAAVTREVAEETGLSIAIEGLAGLREAILPAQGLASAHFVILCFAARWVAGEPKLNDELDEFRWARPDALAGLKTTTGLADIAGDALRLLGA